MESEFHLLHATQVGVDSLRITWESRPGRSYRVTASDPVPAGGWSSAVRSPKRNPRPPPRSISSRDPSDSTGSSPCPSSSGIRIADGQGLWSAACGLRQPSAAFKIPPPRPRRPAPFPPRPPTPAHPERWRATAIHTSDPEPRNAPAVTSPRRARPRKSKSHSAPTPHKAAQAKAPSHQSRKARSTVRNVDRQILAGELPTQDIVVSPSGSSARSETHENFGLT